MKRALHKGRPRPVPPSPAAGPKDGDYAVVFVAGRIVAESPDAAARKALDRLIRAETEWMHLLVVGKPRPEKPKTIDLGGELAAAYQRAAEELGVAPVRSLERALADLRGEVLDQRHYLEALIEDTAHLARRASVILRLTPARRHSGAPGAER